MMNNIVLNGDDFNAFYNQNKEALFHLDGLSKINIFVGSNNSGKSRFMRSIAKIDCYRKVISDVVLNDFNKLCFQSKTEFIELMKTKDLYYNFNIINKNKIDSLLSPLESPYQKKNDTDIINEFENRLEDVIELMIDFANVSIVNENKELELRFIYEKYFNKSLSISGVYKPLVIEILNRYGTKYYLKLCEYHEYFYTKIYNRIYIPILRGLRSFDISMYDLLSSEIIRIIKGTQDIDDIIARRIRDDIFLRRIHKDYFDDYNDAETQYNIPVRIQNWLKFVDRLENSKEYSIGYIRRNLKNDIIRFNNNIKNKTIKVPDDSVVENFIANIERLIKGRDKPSILFEELKLHIANCQGELKHLIRKGFKNLSDSEVIRANRLVIEHLFKDEIVRSEIEVFSGLSLYDEVRDMLLGEQTEREKVKLFEAFLGKHFFNGVDVSIIPRKDDNVLYVKIGDLPEREIYNLGDGIKSIIILTFPIFKYADKECWFFIEEPEIYLHPTYQRKLIDVMLNKDNILGQKDVKHKYFITTHSNHFLDLTFDEEDISIYSMSMMQDENDKTKLTEKFIVEPVSTGEESVLKNLGVRDSSVFLSNCTIWVEGITDIFYIRKYLEEYMKNKLKDDQVKFSENIHYSFIEYGGNNITHWSFLDKEENPISYKRISKNIFLIVDRDKYEDPCDDDSESERTEKQRRIDYLKENLGDHFYLLGVKEIENLISPVVLFNVVKDYESGQVRIRNNDGSEEESSDFHTFEDVEERIKYQDYNSKSIGGYIDSLVVTTRNDGKYEYNTSSDENKGTIKDKRGFCDRAVKYITYENMEQESKNMAEKIYNFIAKFNT